MKMLVTVAMIRYQLQCNEHILVQLFCKAFCTFLLLRCIVRYEAGDCGIGEVFQ